MKILAINYIRNNLQVKYNGSIINLQINQESRNKCVRFVKPENKHLKTQLKQQNYIFDSIKV